MAEFLPFKGTRYDASRVSMAGVVAPPYDVVSPAYRDVLYDRHPYNVIRLELNREIDPYTAAAHTFEEWKRAGILRLDEHPQFYVYYQRFDDPNGTEYTREGVIGRLRLTPYSEKQVLPHERTLAGPKRDRYQLLEATSTNLSPIFGLIDDETLLFDHTLEVATVRTALVDVDETLETGEHVRHLLWPLTDPMAADRIQKIVAGQQVIIADGHHRYETSVAFAQTHPEIEGAQYMMVFLSNLRAPGTVILPTHRVLYGLENFDAYRFLQAVLERFQIQEFERRDDALTALEDDHHAITMIELDTEPHYVLVRQRTDSNPGSALGGLPVQVLHEEILKGAAGLTQEAIDNKTNLLYPHSVAERDAMVEGRQTNATFYLRAVSPAEMARVVQEGSFMPQKSTFFFPKLLTGLVFHEFLAQ